MKVGPVPLMASSNSGAVLSVPSVATPEADNTFITTRALAADSSEARSPAIATFDNAESASTMANGQPVARILSNAIPAMFERVRPSNANGWVTIANTVALADMAVRITVGMSSNVVFPPSPAITKVIGGLPIAVLRRNRSLTSARSSSDSPF